MPSIATSKLCKSFVGDLMLLLRNERNVSVFVEGGTHLGNTSYWASQHFQAVHTVEAEKTFFDAFELLPDKPANVRFYFGTTSQRLPEILKSVPSSAIYWLDSHWSAGASFGEGDECPLLQEIELIYHSASDPFIFIDDARLFLSPPPPPHDVNQWPGIRETLAALSAGERDPYVVIVHDTIISVPRSAEKIVQNWCRDTSGAVRPTSAESMFSRGKRKLGFR